LQNDSGIYKFREWLKVLDNSANHFEDEDEDDEDEDEDYENDIKSTLKMVKDSISDNIIEKWISSDIYAYSKELCVGAGEPQLYELSITIDNNNTENLSDMSFNWTHHTITEQTLYNLFKWLLYKWIIKEEKKELFMSNISNDTDIQFFKVPYKEDMDTIKILNKMWLWTTLLAYDKFFE